MLRPAKPLTEQFEENQNFVPGSACSQGGGWICLTPRRSILKSKTSRKACRVLRDGMARPVGEHAFSVAQHSLLVEEIFGTIVPEATTEQRLDQPCCTMHPNM